MKITKIIDFSFSQNCFLVESNSKSFLIDPGYNIDKIEEAIGLYGIDFILLTHYHFDHVASVDKLCKEYDIKAYIHEDDSILVTTDTLAEMMGFEQVTVSKSNLITFRDSIEELPFINIIHLPGHTPGSVAFQIESSLFIGDTLFDYSIGRTDFPNSNHEDMVKSLNKIKKLDGGLKVYCGHGEDFLLLRAQQENPYLK